MAADRPDLLRERPAPPPRRLHAVVLVPTLLTLGVVAALAVASLEVLSAVRAFVSGESAWSKARAQAVEALVDYGRTLDPADYRRFEQALVVPLADRRAREELDKAEPDLEVARSELERGGNHAEDVPGMILLYRRFGDGTLFAQPLQAWREGDALIERLREVAQRLHVEAERGQPDTEALRMALAEVHTISAQLADTERRFGRSMGEVGRLVGNVLAAALVIVALALAGAAVWVVRRALDLRARHERELQAAHERWLLAAEGGGLGLYDWDIERDELRLDPKAASMYGLAAAEGEPAVVRRETLSALLHPDDLGPTRTLVDEALATHRLFRARYRIVGPQGAVRHLEATGTVQQRDDGVRRFTRMVGVVRDVTEEERQFERARERDAAERAARTRMEFLSRLSHELRTPLNAILGFAQLMALERSPPLPPRDGERVRQILDSGRQLLALVDDVLDITRLDAGALHLQRVPVSTAAAVQHVLAQLEALARSRQVSLAPAELPDGGASPWVLADEQRLQQVLMNLVANACLYNRPGGRVQVRVRRRGHPAGERVAIEVADTGPGLTHEDRLLLFQPFQRVAATAGSAEGSGLGLFIVKSLVERMNGAVEVSSVVGEGSLFTVLLPAAPAPAPTADAEGTSRR